MLYFTYRLRNWFKRVCLLFFGAILEDRATIVPLHLAGKLANKEAKANPKSKIGIYYPNYPGLGVSLANTIM